MIFAFGTYELDTRLYELRHRGQACAVEPQVFNVLAYLAEHRDRVVSKEELLEELWQDRFVSETTLTSRLKAARKAVGDDGKSQNVIRTIHGRGYRFVATVRDVETESVAVVPFAIPPRPSGIVGRDLELARLRHSLALAREGKRQVVFVTGEAGAGKTTLVETFLAGTPATTSTLVARGQCVEHRGSGEPYMPLLDALGRLCRGDDPKLTVELLRREAPGWLLQMPWLLSDDDAARLAARPSSPDRMLRELGMLLERMTQDVPLVLFLEDLHWSDSATLEALDLVARQTHAARLLVIATFRPFDMKASELRAHGLCDWIELPLLGVPEIESYLQTRLPGAELIGDLAALLHERTSGNPLFVMNLVSSWLARGMIRERDGEWALDATVATLETDVPESLQQLIAKRVAELALDDQRLLETASILGCSFSTTLLASTSPEGTTEDDVEQRCEALARDGRFLAAAGMEWSDGTVSSRFAFTHDLYVDVLYERVAGARRVRMHQRAGLALERIWNGRERERAAELALHFRRAHDHPRAIRYLTMAAEQAMERSAYREAVMQFTSALELLGDDDRTELALRARLAPALIATGGWADADAEENYARACELARALDDRATLSQMLYGMAVMFEYRGDYGRAEEIVLERLALDGDAAATNVIESHGLLACSMVHQGRFAEALERGESAISAASRSAQPLDAATLSVLVQVHGWMSLALAFLGRPEGAIAHGALALRIAETKGDELIRASALTHAAFVRFHHGEVEECRRLSAAAEAIARTRRLPFHLASARILLGWCRSHRGAHDEALRDIRAGIRLSLVAGARMDLPLFYAILADCLTRAGDDASALEALEEAFAHAGNSRSFFYVPELYRMVADFLLARGDVTTARAALEQAQAAANEQQSPLFAGRVAESLAIWSAAATPPL